ncbi:hypothetical protein G6F50_018491 [Rhizopus delemar]|uniref:Uncharacterized protein n=1 Tax=Rhizopus delemar TaxID=936053 RepID=A0A9P7BZ99_9FUNG|nr:hypothetical protein G6F23_015826 [Rhizopus arrhizus]KAG1524953.1 hypothetical protein G6F50_018491 [Rhizopus delemar]
MPQRLHGGGRGAGRRPHDAQRHQRQQQPEPRVAQQGGQEASGGLRAAGLQCKIIGHSRASSNGLPASAPPR